MESDVVGAQCARIILAYVEALREAPDSPTRLARELLNLESDLHVLRNGLHQLADRARELGIAFNPGAVAAFGLPKGNGQ